MIIGSKVMAEKLGISVFTLNRYCRNGMPYTQISPKKRAYDEDEVKAWIKSKGRSKYDLVD